MQTVVELPEFQRKSSKLLSADENSYVISYLAAHPAAGVTVFGKGEKANLIKSERNDLATQLTAVLVKNFGGKK